MAISYREMKKAAQAAGYYIREGSYRNTTDDKLGRFYVSHKDAEFFRPFGPGYTRKGAWEHAYEIAVQERTR